MYNLALIRRLPARFGRAAALVLAVVLATAVAIVGEGSHSQAAALVDAAANSPLFCAGDGYGHNAVNLVDADDTSETTFHGGETHFGSYATFNQLQCSVDLGEPIPVTNAAITFGQDGNRIPVVFGTQYCTSNGIVDWQLEGSVDGVTWTLYTPPMRQQWTGTGSNAPGSAQTVTVNGTAQFLRLTVAACWPKDYGVVSLKALSSVTSRYAATSQLDVRHNPPLLILPGEPAELQYDVVCRFTVLDTVGCEPQGEVFLTRSDGTQRELALAQGDASRKWRMYAVIPADFLTAGTTFTYYATVQDGNTGASATLPTGGAASPQTAFVVAPTSTTALGTTAFPAPRPTTDIVSTGAWGAGDNQFGLDGGDQQSKIGPASFDVADDGTVYILDGVNRRIASVAPTGGRTNLPLAANFPVERADIAVAKGGALVLGEAVDFTPGQVHLALLGPQAQSIGNSSIAASIVDQVRTTPAGTFAHYYPDDAWIGPVSSGESGVNLAPTAGQPVGANSQLISKVTSNEARFALVTNGQPTTFWRVTSDTAFGELQLAQPVGNDLLIVLRQFDDSNAQFRVLRLDGSGTITYDAALDPAEFAETSPVSRFRLVGDNLYMARSDQLGFSIARYVIGGTA